MYDADKGDENDEKAWIQKEQNVHRSRLYKEGFPLQYQSDIIDTSQMEQLLLLKRNDIHSIECFEAIFDGFIKYASNFSILIYGVVEATIYYYQINLFISKNIFKFLYEPQFDYYINCLLEPHNDGKLILKNLRQTDIRTSYKALCDGSMTKGFSLYEHTLYTCDWCRCGLRGFNYIYQCSVKHTDRHDICINCVYTVIRLSTELQMYLAALLKDILIDNCIEVIVDFVIGKVVCIPTVKLYFIYKY